MDKILLAKVGISSLPMDTLMMTFLCRYTPDQTKPKMKFIIRVEVKRSQDHYSALRIHNNASYCYLKARWVVSPRGINV